MTGEEAWRTEERFWTGGQDHSSEALDPECAMAFPAPAGIVHGTGIAASLAQAPRWSSVETADKHAGRPAEGLIVLAYRARGLREGAAPYLAYCTSTYRHDGDRWRLVQHQQTPV